ncbi:MAG: tetratricopeptide repeat protein, partial [Acidiferrobacterales bacterium]|nr:tetratricopeptide repeat protein [Acidiferrobacterales bacterium]
MTESSQSESSLRLAHQHAQQYMQSGDFDVAVEILEELLGQEPDNTQALYLLAVCLRKQKNYDRARDNLDKLIGHKQNYGHAYQELGHLETERNDLPAAIKFYQRAIQINPALHGAWRALSTFKDYPQRAEALRQVQWFDSLPAELKSVSSFLHQGQLKKAESLCRVFLQRQPHHPEAMRLLAQLSIKFNHLEDAEVLLSKCIEFAPKHYQAHIDLIEVLHRRQKYVKALDHAYSLNETDPQNTAFIICLANALQATGDYKAAIEKYRHALTLLPHNPSVQVALGNALKTSGGVKQAIQAYRSAYETDAGCGEAYWSLANLKTYPFSQNELKNMKEQIARPELPPLELARLHFALGKAYEDQKDFRQSFQHYNDGNKIKRQEQPFDLSRLKEDLAFQKQHFNQDFFAQRQGFGCNADDPIFILGMPRAGSTLLEQILASHSQVDGTMELANIIAYAHRLSPKEASLKK